MTRIFIALFSFALVFAQSSAAADIQWLGYGCDCTAETKTEPQFIVCDECEAPKNVKAAERVFRKNYPGVEYESFRKMDIPGVYEVARGGNALYFAPPDFLVLGEILRDGKSITATRRDERISALIKDLPLDKVVKIGDGQNTVIEFADPDCPFCRKAAGWFEKKDDVTRYVFFFPLTNIHPDAGKKAKWILCSDNPASAYSAAMKGDLDNGEFELLTSCKEKADPLLAESMSWARKLGVSSTPTFWINGERVNGTNFQQIENLLNGGDRK
ncbi:MAG: DsbC family protein [Candidatus Nitrospinota bacterium M3_3B_026]